MTPQQRATILALSKRIQANYTAHGDRIWKMPPEVQAEMIQLTDELQEQLAALDDPIVRFLPRRKEHAA